MIPIAGVDPGVSGGIAIVMGHVLIEVVEMPPDEEAIWRYFERAVDVHGVAAAVIERVASRPKQGVRSVFKFGFGYGGLRMAVRGNGIPFCNPTPQTWCKSLGLRREKEEPQAAWKNRHKVLAAELFPHARITHATADALLLACYGVRLVSELVDQHQVEETAPGPVPIHFKTRSDLRLPRRALSW